MLFSLFFFFLGSFMPFLATEIDFLTDSLKNSSSCFSKTKKNSRISRRLPATWPALDRGWWTSLAGPNSMPGVSSRAPHRHVVFSQNGENWSFQDDAKKKYAELVTSLRGAAAEQQTTSSGASVFGLDPVPGLDVRRYIFSTLIRSLNFD